MSLGCSPLEKYHFPWKYSCVYNVFVRRYAETKSEELHGSMRNIIPSNKELEVNEI